LPEMPEAQDKGECKMMDVGRLCVKTAGREAGKYCVIVKKVDDNFVMVTGPKEVTKVKRRNCNIEHLEPLEEKLKISSGASDETVLSALKSEGIMKKFGFKVETKKEPTKADKKAKK